MIDVRCSDEVRDTLAAGGAVVAMESTIYSNLGLPAPANGEALERCIAAVRSQGAVPAVTAVLDGDLYSFVEAYLVQQAQQQGR